MVSVQDSKILSKEGIFNFGKLIPPDDEGTKLCNTMQDNKEITKWRGLAAARFEFPGAHRKNKRCR